MLENSVYSVISPEGCASIMWRDSSKAELAAEALKITARRPARIEIIDEIVPEPEGGAHMDPELTAKLFEPFLERSLASWAAPANSWSRSVTRNSGGDWAVFCVRDSRPAFE